MDSTSAPKSAASHSIVQIFTVILLVIGAFLLGSLWQRVQFLEKNTGISAVANPTGTAAAPAAKYKSVAEAMGMVARAANVDEKRLINCLNSGEKASAVNAQAQQASELGVSGTPGFFINGRFLGGAFPFATFKQIIDKELDGTATDVAADYSADLKDAADKGYFDPKPKNVDIGDAPVEGSKDAKVTIVEFSDFQCPFCERAIPTIAQVMKDYSGKVRLVYKHLPLTQIHPLAQKSAEAAECAKDQGKFWEFHDQLFKLQNDWTQV